LFGNRSLPIAANYSLSAVSEPLSSTSKSGRETEGWPSPSL